MREAERKKKDDRNWILTEKEGENKITERKVKKDGENDIYTERDITVIFYAVESETSKIV